MKTSSFIKSLLALFGAFLTSSAFAAAYHNYWSNVDSKGLSVIIFVVMILGAMALQVKRT